MNQDQRDELKATVYAEHYSRAVEPITGEAVEFLNEPHPWAVLIADRGLVFFDTREEAVALRDSTDDVFMDGERTLMRLYATIERADGRKFARYV